MHNGFGNELFVVSDYTLGSVIFVISDYTLGSTAKYQNNPSLTFQPNLLET